MPASGKTDVHTGVSDNHGPDSANVSDCQLLNRILCESRPCIWNYVVYSGLTLLAAEHMFDK